MERALWIFRFKTITWGLGFLGIFAWLLAHRKIVWELSLGLQDLKLGETGLLRQGGPVGGN